MTIQTLKFPLIVKGCNWTVLDQVDGQAKLELHIGHHLEMITLWTMNLTDMDILLGYDWLQHHNPQIDWKHGTFALKKCPDLCLDKWDRGLTRTISYTSWMFKET